MQTQPEAGGAAHPRVLISYAHEDDGGAQADRVFELSERLRGDGVDAAIDQYEPNPPEGWPRWMDSHIRESDFVLMVCTETYYRRVIGQEAPGVGLGVEWEGNLIYNSLYGSGVTDARFVPILFGAGGARFIPDPARGFTRYVLPADYERLYRHLTGQPAVRKGPLGPIKPLSARSAPPPSAPQSETPPATGSAAFQRFYLKSLAETVHLTHYLGDYDAAQLDAALAALLKLIRAVAAAFYGDRSGLEINANVMAAAPVRSPRRADYPGLLFAGPDWHPQAYRAVLRLSRWAEPSDSLPQEMALPVDRNPLAVLFGAPQAFLSEQPQRIGDTRDGKELTALLNNQPEAVAREVRAYTEEARFRSFISWPVFHQDIPLGVLNIQSSLPQLFSEEENQNGGINGYIRPFCFVLGLVIAASDAEKSRAPREEAWNVK